MLSTLATSVLAVLSLLRTQGAGATDTIWAEDGGRFYQDSLRKNAFTLVFTPYNGYLHFIPRVFTQIAGLFPLDYLALVFAVLGATSTGLISVFVYHASRASLGSRVLQAVVAAPVALTWIAQAELGNNVVDTQWYLLYAAFWAVIYFPGGRFQQACCAVILFCAIASDPFAVVFASIFLIRLWISRDRLRSNVMVGAAFAAGIIYQGIGIVFKSALSSRPGVSSRYDLGWSSKAYVDNVLGRTLWWGESPYYVSWIFVALFGALSLAYVTRARHELAVAALASSVVLYILLVSKGGITATRYAAPAASLLLVSITAAFATRSEVPTFPKRGITTPRLRNASLASVVAICVTMSYANGPDVSLRNQSPSWSSQLAAASEKCELPSVLTVDVVIAPSSWKVRLPCASVRHRSDFLR